MIRREWLIGLTMMLSLAGGCGDDGNDGEPIDEERDASVDQVVASDAGTDARVVRDASNVTPGDSSVRGPGGRDAEVSDASRADASSRDASVADASADDARVADAASRPATAPWLIQPGDSVLFIGNSFFDAYNRKLADWVKAVGQAVTPKFAIDTAGHIVPGNMPLKWFFEQSESADAIASGRYDIFILQGEEMEPVSNKKGFQDAVRAYHKAITAKGGKVMLFMTWDFMDSDPDSDFYQKLSAAYDEIGRELNIPVIPVGTIYNDCRKDLFPGEDPYFLNENMSQNGVDHLHQSAQGSAVNAYATFAMLTGRNPAGVSFSVAGNDNSDAFLKYASEKSWARVSERLQQ